MDIMEGNVPTNPVIEIDDNFELNEPEINMEDSLHYNNSKGNNTENNREERVQKRRSTRKMNALANYQLATLESDNPRKKSKYMKAYYICRFCEFKTIMSTALVNHMEKEHLGEPINCNFCSKDFDTSELFRDHVKTVHKKYKDVEDIYTCDECGKILQGRYHLESHKESVHSFKVSICEFCCNEFKNRKQLRWHINRVHKDHENAICDVCSKIFRNKNLLYHHKRTVHEVVKDLMCYICGTSVMNDYKLQRHLKKCQKRERKKPKNFEYGEGNLYCEECNKTFISLKALKGHMKAAHTYDPIHCQVCQKEFKNIFLFRQHLRRQHQIVEPDHVLALIRDVKPDFDGFNTKKKKKKKGEISGEPDYPSWENNDSSTFNVKEYLSLKNANDSANVDNPQDPENLTEHQKKRIEIVKQWREKEQEQNERMEAEMRASESTNNVRSQRLSQDSDKGLKNGDTKEDIDVNLLLKCDVKLEAASDDDSDDGFPEKKEFLEKLDKCKDGGSGSHTCVQCGKSFTKSKLRDHIKVVHTYEPCPCPFCEGKILKNQTILAQHLKRFHKDYVYKLPSNRDEESTFDKDDTDNDTDNFDIKREEEQLQEQLNESVEEGNKCVECGKSFSQLKNLNFHMKTAHTYEPCACPFCDDKILKNQVYLSQHLKRFHKTSKLPEEKIDNENEDLGEGFDIKTEDDDREDDGNDSAHFMLEFPDSPKDEEKIEDSKEDSSDQLKCDECGKLFSQLKRLKGHIKVAHTYQPCPCPFCEDKVLKNPTYLAQHLQRYHKDYNFSEDKNGEKKTKSEKENASEELNNADQTIEDTYDQFDDENMMYGCKECDKSFPKLKYLKGHERTVHKNDPCPCPVCGNSCRNQTYLAQHMKRAHSNTVDAIEECICQECGKTCKSKKALKGHLKTVHPEEGDSRICPICAKKFKSSHYLRDHLRRSLGCCPAQTVVCPECGKEFANKGLLYNHHIDIHVIDNVNCPICGRTYRNRRALGKHCKHAHNGMVKNPYSKGTGEEQPCSSSSLPHIPKDRPSAPVPPPPPPPAPSMLGYPGMLSQINQKGYPGMLSQINQKGYPGVLGDKGYPGMLGDKGYPGMLSDKGYPGMLGDKGYPGMLSEKGYPGMLGDKGYPGMISPSGWN